MTKTIPPTIRAWMRRHPWATLAWVRSWLATRKRPHPPAAFLTMFDSITPDAIPATAEAVAGYVDGRWPTFPGLAKSHPRAHRLSIAVFPSDPADCLDIEKGDATPAQAPTWLRSKATSEATPKPVLYSSASSADALIQTMQAAGIPRSSYLLWTAHYRPDRKPHICDATCGGGFHGHADATQYDDHALGRNLDVSHVRAGFFRGT